MGWFALLWVAALSLPQTAPEPEGLRIYSPTQFGVTAETPSRMPGSREEMNRGRNTAIARPVQDREGQRDALRRRLGRVRDGGHLQARLQ